ncbi:hypothetical protein [Nocardioides marmotae]|uniref:hypothetical protein n=1 Tax=Nocardioides marmotae TaxID=2663857 RepID=UPI0012B58574|nr:hypothetical protein [Nocardioides marmotae]MBC9733193.1 hypothetical protein [Nocardioides marmotae]MTB84305.1 hypothetical protein [Nocardioides marmotae]
MSTTLRGTAPRRARRPLARTATALTLSLALAWGATACSGDGDEPAGDRTAGQRHTTAAPAPEGPLPTTTTIGRVTGRLAADRRRPLKRQVARVVDGWLDAAYVGGDFPRVGGFRQAFPGFSSGAKDEARRDLRLMTNVGIAGRITGVDVRRRELRLDVLAVRGRPAGVTARVLLVFETEGDVRRRDRVAGRLYLTWRNGGWQVFGYDVSRGRAR